MPVAIAPTGVELTVKKVLTDEKTKRHLENLGLGTGASVTVLTHEGGTAILLVKEGRLALDRNITTKIFVG